MSKRAPARRRTKPNVIETTGLTKRFAGLVAVRDLDLQVRQGEVFGYLGPNGAGKSTTIRMLLDFIRPTQGTCSILGGSGADPEIRKRVGYLPGELRFDPKYSTDDIVEFYGKLRGPTPKAASLIERFKLDPRRPIGQLSSGNKRKVGIVQAFMHAPEVLLLDEPTAGLDPLLQEEFNHLVRETVAEGTTILLSSHFLHEVEELASRVGILRRGELIAVAAVEALRRRARQRVDLYFKQKVDPKVFLKIPEVKEASFAHGMMRLSISGPVEAVLRTAARLHAYRIVSPQTDLEEIFLDLYGKNEPDA